MKHYLKNIKHLLIFTLPIFVGCTDLKSDDYKQEAFNGKVISYDPPKRFYITYKLGNGDVHTEYISKRCSVKSDIIGTDVYVTKYTHKKTKEVVYQLHNDKSCFCN